MTRGVYMHYLRFFSSSTRNWVTKKKVSKVGLKKKEYIIRRLTYPKLPDWAVLLWGRRGGGVKIFV